MKTAVTLDPPLLRDIDASPGLADARERLSLLIAMTKPRLTTMVLITVATGFLLGARMSAAPWTMLWTMLGTALVAGGAGVWNQVLEKDRDGRMRRTANRPLPSGKVGVVEASLFGLGLLVAGLAMLAIGANPLAATVAAATFILYVLVYTPLKPISTLNTVVGAIPGALPPVIGWAAATGRLGIEAWALFLVLFLWQFPHFLAIAWIYRDDYARGGHKMLPTLDPSGALTGRQAAGYALALLPAGLLPAAIGLAGPWYFVGALLFGAFYLRAAVLFWLDVNDASARRLLRASFLYLPGILFLLLLNPLPA